MYGVREGGAVLLSLAGLTSVLLRFIPSPSCEVQGGILIHFPPPNPHGKIRNAEEFV